jgi:hypothetical protein
LVSSADVGSNMGRLQRMRQGLLAIVCILGLLLGLGSPWLQNAMEPGMINPAFRPERTVAAESGRGSASLHDSQTWYDTLQTGLTQAEQTGMLTQRAVTALQWDQVVQGWLGVIGTLQLIPAQSPQRPFVQRKLREYGQNLIAAQNRAERVSIPYVFPSLGSPVLDEQLILYLSYVATLGVPDVLIVGSSRALQGIDPQIFQRSVATQGYAQPRVYNWSVNGATAQVVDFMLQQLLMPEQLPKLVIWGDGSRAFNSARRDRTFTSVSSSAGYQAARSGQKPRLATDALPSEQATPRPVVTQSGATNAYGFLAVSEQFEPETYYQRFPKVNGRYDEFYNPFSLQGIQTTALEAVATFLNSRQIPLIYVNLPLSGDYLDPFRLNHERQFQQFLQTQSQQNRFGVIDLLQQWPTQNTFFADPSHLNRVGATAIARQLATHPLVKAALTRENRENPT